MANDSRCSSSVYSSSLATTSQSTSRPGGGNARRPAHGHGHGHSNVNGQDRPSRSRQTSTASSLMSSRSQSSSGPSLSSSAVLSVGSKYQQKCATLPETQAWVTVPVPDSKGAVNFRPRGFSTSTAHSSANTNWSVKRHYMMAVRSGPSECPPHILAKDPLFNSDGTPESNTSSAATSSGAPTPGLDTPSFPSPYCLYYFDETAPNNLLIANHLKKRFCGVDGKRIPTNTQGRETTAPKKEQLGYSVRKLFFDVDDIRTPPSDSVMKMLPSYSVSYANYPAVAYDVIAPHHYQDFFRDRKAPTLFA